MKIVMSEAIGQYWRGEIVDGLVLGKSLSDVRTANVSGLWASQHIPLT